MSRNSEHDGSQHHRARRLERTKKRARRPTGKDPQAELFCTGPPSQRVFPSGEKVGRPKEEGAGRRHETRPTLDPRVPLHVTIRLRAGLPSLRGGEAFRVVLRCLRAARERFGMRLLHFSVQGNHIHLLVEVDGSELEPAGLPALRIPRRGELAKRALSKGMKGLQVRMARGLGALWRRRGPVFEDLYHVVALDCPEKVWRALRYVLTNGFKHGVCRLPVDPCSSGAWFDGWERPIPPAHEPPEERPVVPAKTWLAREGWKRHGSIPFPVEVVTVP